MIPTSQSGILIAAIPAKSQTSGKKATRSWISSCVMKKQYLIQYDKAS